MTAVSNTTGFEILQKLYHDETQKKEDVIILFLHWYLIKLGFKCTGINNQNVTNSSEKGSELLPKEWNTGPNYTLRYIKGGKLFGLYGIKSDADILLNFTRLDNDQISNIHFPIEETISALHGPLETVMPTYQAFLYNIQKDFIGPICPEDICNVATQTTATSERQESTIYDHRPLSEPPRLPYRQPAQEPWRVGVADLYPGARGGGMIFDPFSDRSSSHLPAGIGIPGRLPPDARPPGSRFFPFGPSDPDPQRLFPRREDNDDLLPPRFHEDMFM